MIPAMIRKAQPLLGCLLLAIELLMLPTRSEAGTVLKPIPTQFIAALGDPGRVCRGWSASMGPMARGSGSSRSGAERL
jgi:hypothetical protein